VKAGANPNATMAEGLTMLMLAASAGNLEAVRALVADGARVNAREPVLGETALMWAARDNHADVIELLAHNGADLDAQASLTPLSRRLDGDAGQRGVDMSIRGSTALMYAVRKNADTAVRALIAAGADVNVKGPDGTTALQLAISAGHSDLTGLLLQRAADSSNQRRHAP
jgi:ankyrin repeat protein